jgi:hypothetical protein
VPFSKLEGNQSKLEALQMDVLDAIQVLAPRGCVCGFALRARSLLR